MSEPGRPVLFVNPKSGGGRAVRGRVAELARERGIEAVELGPGQELAALAEEAVRKGADALGMAGGDGSLGIVAAAAQAHGLPFVCVPTGTRNHFARDLGVDPDDPAGALEAFGDGVERRIDVGSVNDRLFLNCVSLGIYAEAVHKAAYRDAKLRTLLSTARAVLGPGAEVPELRLLDDVGGEHRRPAIVLVSNNPYALGRPGSHGGRPRLDGGRLGVIVIGPPAGAAPPSGRAWSATSLEVSAPASVPAGLDGEAVELTPPLRFSVRPRALLVRTPRRGGVRGRRRPGAPESPR
ncbi:MAG TPA: diacylglycerol kinase family protein [Solirubrobacterales bacterium]